MHQRVLITDKLVNRIRRNLDNPQKENPRFGFLGWINCDMKWRYIKKNHPRPVQDPWDLPPLFANYLFSVLGPPPWQNIQFQLQTVIYWKSHFVQFSCTTLVQCPVHQLIPISSSQVNLTCLPTCHSWTSSSCLPPHSWKSYHGKTVAIIDHITVLWETVVRWSFYDVVFFPAHLVHLFPEVFFRKFIICSLPRQQTPPVSTIGLFSLNLVESLEYKY